MVDSTCFDNWHLQFNSQLIVILSNLASVVEYRGAQDIGVNLPNVNHKKLFVIKGKGFLSIIFRFFFTLLNDIWQLIVTPYDEIIVYSFDPTISLRIINAVNKLLRKRIIMFRHGSLEMLITNSYGNGFVYQFENKLTKNFFLTNKIKVDKNIHFFVLGNVILNNLSSILPQDKLQKFHSVDHPYNFEKKTIIKAPNNFTKLNIGTVGVFNKYKGGNNLLVLVKILNNNGIKGVDFSISGKILSNVNELQENGIDLPSNKGVEMVSIEEMKTRIDRLDFILFFYNSETYRLTASGAIFDAINRKRPIIAIRNDYFEYIFNKFGSIGYLVNSVEEMATLIHRIHTNQEIRQDIDFDKIQNLMSIDNITLDFKNKLREIGFIA